MVAAGERAAGSQSCMLRRMGPGDTCAGSLAGKESNGLDLPTFRVVSPAHQMRDLHRGAPPMGRPMYAATANGQPAISM